MERKLGISIYPEKSTVAADKAYIDLAAAYGFTRIFTCLLSVQKPKEEIIKDFQEIISYANEKGFEVILDVAPVIFDQLQISYDDLSFFHQLHASGIRLDLGFDGNKEAMLTFNPYNLGIEINMSNDVAYLDNIMSYEPNAPYLYGCHNFYPQKGTGLPYDFFVKCSTRFKKYGIRTAAFINSHVATIGPWNINDGLCTLEEHRVLPIEVQAKHLFASNLCDDVIIGNAYASEEELRILGEINRYQVTLTIDMKSSDEVIQAICFNEQHFRRGDITHEVIRSTEVRKKYSYADIPVQGEHDFVRGDILIGNNDFGKYKGELQIVLQDHHDKRKNCVGKIRKDEIILLDFIKPWSKFKLTIGKE